MIGFLREAWTDNRETIGGRQAAPPRHIVAIYVVEGVLAGMLVLVTPSPSSDFLVGSITAFAILAGFSFSSLLFFVDHDFSVLVDKDSREQAALQKRISALSDQLFVNIHYFNLCSLLVICGCLIGLSVPLADRIFVGFANVRIIPIITEFVGRWFLFLIGLESISTFARILKRIRYLFGKVREAHILRLARP